MEKVKNLKAIKALVSEKMRKGLSDKLSYHGLHHTLDVYDVCNKYIRRLKLSKEDANLLRVSALVHDVGIIWSYFGHEEESVRFSEEYLPKYGFTTADLKVIKGLILCTKIPQAPKTLLEKIICDADLDYLGRNDVYTISKTLYDEFMAYNIVQDEESWDRLQVKFLTQHHYHTDFAKKYRAPKKQMYVEGILKKWGWELKQ